MTLDTTFYQRCIETLSNAYFKLQACQPEQIEYEIYRSACVKEFELILEQSGKLLRKLLKPYFHSPKEVDQFPFKDLFRQASLRGFVSVDACERWLIYRDNRNNTAHDYGVSFAEETMQLIPQFVKDANELSIQISKQNDAHSA